ncbi:ornithine cyclodeaminase family protein [Neorhizobium galegae]|uniref:ornithine cyclodeaminase family protein n=1 Tax=Neorhizobium galegae TaxID=399 RepID=UPI00210504D7|nr:ornithine cyclodeaminase family protein [Neorhizobium galegae]MCQ1781244.1 ornithine cyclodeaminase family protein [Neorhizobium galegae]
MNQPHVRWLSRNDVAQTRVPFASALDIIEETLRHHANGASENPPKIGIHPRNDALMHAMPGWLPISRRAGLKWIASYPSNYKLGLPNIIGLLLLSNPDTGLPVCVMDAAYLTAVRTAAVSAITSKYLAPSPVEKIAVVGAGIQGRYHVEMLSLVHPTAVFHVVDIDDNAVRILAEAVGSKATIIPVKDAEVAIRGADVVVTATSRLEDVAFQFSWVREGSLVLPVHVCGWSEDITTASDLLLADDVQQFNSYIKTTGSPYSDISRIAGSMSSVVAGRLPGRRSNVDRIVVFNLGVAIQDVAVGSVIFEIAEQLGLGTLVPY